MEAEGVVSWKAKLAMKRISAIGFLALTVAIAPATQATDNSWTNSASGKWEEPSNWSLGVAPTVNQFVLITNDSTKVVAIDTVTLNTTSAMTVGKLTISTSPNSTNTLVLSGIGLTTPLNV